MDLKELEQVLKLMRENKVDEVSCPEYSIKMTKHDLPITFVKMPQPPTDKEVFDTLDQDAVELWSKQGKK